MENTLDVKWVPHSPSRKKSHGDYWIKLRKVGIWKFRIISRRFVRRNQRIGKWFCTFFWNGKQFFRWGPSGSEGVVPFCFSLENIPGPWSYIRLEFYRKKR